MNTHNKTINERAMDFAVKSVKLAKFLRDQFNEFSLADQVLRSGTSIGANYEEACGAISKADYIAKLNISLKEARESRFWIVLLHNCKLIDDKAFQSLYQDVDSLALILGKSIRTTQKNNQNVK